MTPKRPKKLDAGLLKLPSQRRSAKLRMPPVGCAGEVAVKSKSKRK